jgi:LacI family transcriptional regulator
LAATIKDVARLANCSIKTVSRVVNHEPYVTDETRRRVLAAIAELDYAPNISARRLVQRKSYVICILLHQAGFFQPEVLGKIMEISYEGNYDILLQTYFPSFSRSRNKLAQIIAERRIDGLVTTPPCDADPFLNNLLEQSGIPRVHITPFNRTRGIPYVSGEDFMGAYQMTEHLIQLGHRKIAFLTGPRNHRTSIDRLYGFRAALEAAHLPITPPLELDSEYNFPGGYTAAKMLMALPDPPTAIFAGSNEAAMGAIFALQEFKIDVPDQISICGFGDQATAKQIYPGLTAVYYPVEEIVEKAVLMLVDIVEGRQPENRQIILPTQLVIRGSTAAPLEALKSTDQQIK